MKKNKGQNLVTLSLYVPVIVEVFLFIGRVAGAALFGWSRSRFLVRLRLLILLPLYCKYFIFTGP